MIGAYKGTAIAARRFTDRGTAMPADIMHGVELALIIASDDDGVFANLEQLIIAFIWDFTRMQSIDPASKNEMLEFPFMHQVRPIKIGIDRVIGASKLRCELAA
jgi:hypothetical protein